MTALSIYNRTAHGEPVFSQKREADLFVDLLRSVARRDDLTILAWCFMVNHYVEGPDFREAYESLDAWLTKQKKTERDQSVKSGGSGT